MYQRFMSIIDGLSFGAGFEVITQLVGGLRPIGLSLVMARLILTDFKR